MADVAIATQAIRALKAWSFLSKIDYKNHKEEERDSSFLFAAFRLYEPKSREGVLRPESRGPNTTRLLEYPAVDLVGFPGECSNGEGRGRPNGPA